MIGRFIARAQRVIAPDLIGLRKSDKPTEPGDCIYQRHVDWTAQVLRRLDLTGITLVCQDWGGLIGLRLWTDMAQRFARIVAANAALPIGDQPMVKAVESWRAYSQKAPGLGAGRIVCGGTARKISGTEAAAHDAPFPDASYQAGARQFPM